MSDAFNISVPNTSIGKLMLYLRNIENISNANFGKYSEFSKWYDLYESDKKEVIELCLKFNPKLFCQIGVFVPCKSQDINGQNNFFASIADINMPSLYRVTLNVGSYHLKFTHVMAFTEAYLKGIYAEPLADLISEKTTTTTTTTSTSNYSSSSCGYGGSEFMFCMCSCCDCGFTDFCEPCSNSKGCGWGPILVFVLSIFLPLGYIFMIAGCIEGKWRMRCCSFYGMIIGYIIMIYSIAGGTLFENFFSIA